MRVRPDADGNTQQELGDRVGSYDRSHHGEARSTRLGALGKDRNVEVERRPEQEGGGAQEGAGTGDASRWVRGRSPTEQAPFAVPSERTAHGVLTRTQTTASQRC